MADLDALLEQSSRTFALTIPFLPEPTRREVTVAYLLFRIADTLEDGEAWSTPQRLDALRTFDQLLNAAPPRAELGQFLQSLQATPPTVHAAYRELLAETLAVSHALDALPPKAREV
ncbi:MAG: squalene/phytoene synthase family protein, partial [Deltaproteobacteria bacterium]|nr:squalene/phytoene synthase family protein [Deltaproteobacteria bacterium]